MNANANDLVIFVQMRVRFAAKGKFLAALETLAAAHPQATMTVAGISGDNRYLRVTLGINLGPRDEVARFSDQATAAYALVQAVFTDLFDHLPQYVAEPSATEQAAAAALAEAGSATVETTDVPADTSTFAQIESAGLLTSA